MNISQNILWNIMNLSWEKNSPFLWFNYLTSLLQLIFPFSTRFLPFVLSDFHISVAQRTSAMFGQKSPCCCQSRASGESGCGEVRHRWRNDRGWKSRDQGRHVPGVQEGKRCWWVHIVPTVNYANYLSGI